MAEQDFLNFAKGFSALHARLPFPEHDETLATDTAFGFSVSLRTLAQNLHRSYLVLARRLPATKSQ
jgi:hypothetical protein